MTNLPLVNARGTPLHADPKIVVLKYPPDTHLNPQLVAAIAKATGCHVIVLPMDAELMMGRVAHQGVVSTHSGIHAILNIPPDFTEEEHIILTSALKYLCMQTQPSEDSKELLLYKKLNSST